MVATTIDEPRAGTEGGPQIEGVSTGSKRINRDPADEICTPLFRVQRVLHTESWNGDETAQGFQSTPVYRSLSQPL